MELLKYKDMKEPKFKKFLAVLSDGESIEFKYPVPITCKYVQTLAYHCINRQYGTNISPFDVVSIQGIK